MRRVSIKKNGSDVLGKCLLFTAMCAIAIVLSQDIVFDISKMIATYFVQRYGYRVCTFVFVLFLIWCAGCWVYTYLHKEDNVVETASDTK